jgi:hypothetical protein
MTATDAAIREIKCLIEMKSATMKPTTVEPKNKESEVPRYRILKNNIATQKNEERMEGVDCGDLNQSRHALS